MEKRILKMPTEVTVQNLFIFNSTLSKTEDDGANKILFYYPTQEDENKKVLNIGHIEAVICFMRNFNDSQSCESLRTKKSLQVMYNAEQNFWIVIKLSAVCKSSQKSSETQNNVEYCTYNLQEPIYLSILKHWYYTFLMIVGSMTDIMNESGPDKLRLLLKQFYNKYLQISNVSNYTFMDLFHGISFLPLDNTVHLYAQSFLNTIENSFIQVNYTLLLYNDSLVWSGLSKQQTQLVYSYILMWVLPDITRDENIVKGNSLKKCLPNQLVGRFITNTWAIITDSWNSDLGKVPVFLLNDENDGTIKKYRLIMYKAHNSIVCMFMKMENSLTIDLYNRLDQFLSTKLHLLSEKMKNTVEKMLPLKIHVERPAKFIYFNAMNLAIKNSIKLSNTLATTRPLDFYLSPETLRVLVDISNQNINKLPTCSTMVKTSNDNWIASHLCNSREIYIVLNQKLTKLCDVDMEIQNLCAQELGTIFFYD
ncbi:vacuolar fusion protein CCZ1 homolog [Daktulosphaira vitifoliae]|uniref:vacuolar fusion protein CCZ1 homolog n=1 Tax=Daktulosphaira vitifoliae TaxID=58002 RepID=UPI0021A9B9AE|nr:vacuolar fusion protein CCZ1 homolog [Daktulosphaira vitifoliae]